MTEIYDRSKADWARDALPAEAVEMIDAGPSPQVLAKQFLGRLTEEGQTEVDMDTYVEQAACGTTACLAGWAILDCGIMFNDDENFIVGGKYIDPDHAGAYALGLGRRESEVMFLSTSTERIGEVVAERFGLDLGEV